MPLVIAYRPVELPPALTAACLAAPAHGEPHTPAFHARLQRRAPSLRQRLARPRRLHSAAVAALAVALAGFAPFGWDAALIEPATARTSGAALQPFETPGENFPGSAFYYLAPASGVVAARPSPTPGSPAPSGTAAPLDAALGDAIARPTFLAGTALDQARALQCLTTAIYYEAATEPEAGQRAVAQVVLNRVAHPAWPDSVCGVVYQGSDRPGCQFSFACDGSMARAPAPMWWLRARTVATRALAGEVYAPAGLATHYHTSAVHPVWADRLGFVGTIGAHRFYRNAGAGGTVAAFSQRYFGGEPVPAPRPRALVPLAPAGDPLVLAEAFAEARSQAVRAGGAAPALTRAAPSAVAPPDTLPGASGIRPEYRNSGRWIAQPKG